MGQTTLKQDLKNFKLTSLLSSIFQDCRLPNLTAVLDIYILNFINFINFYEFYQFKVRKDLLPTAPAVVSPEEIANVFQAEEDKSSGSSPASSSAQYKCLECSMVFGTDAQLRSHHRHAQHGSNEESTALLLCPICKTAVLQGLENLKVHLYKSHGIGNAQLLFILFYNFIH